MPDLLSPEIHVVGGGLAGCETSYQLLKAGFEVTLHEMRPENCSPAHKTEHLAELVCSNSFKSVDENSAPGQLKWEMLELDSLVIKAAIKHRVAAGQALAVDREALSQEVATQLESFRGFRLLRKELKALPSFSEMQSKNQYWTIATGPLTADSLAHNLIESTCSRGALHFYDAIAPIINADSIDQSKGFWANRWDKGKTADYFNIPLDELQYKTLLQDIAAAEKMPLHAFEKTKYFESCLPIEVMAERGPETLRFGPLKPVGLCPPGSTKWPYAVVQLRKENEQSSMLSMVGFQTKMKWPDQQRVFRKFPGLESAEFFRLGSVHRNTYFEGPRILNPDLSLKSNNRVQIAGQLTGVEGYSESTAIGLLAGLALAARLGGKLWTMPPATTMLGSLLNYVTVGPLGAYQPMNANFGLLPSIQRRKGVGKSEVKKLKCQAARESFSLWK